ncbi:N-acetyllactosaminide beta-1,6-N-acetylglucosaminyl-transferase-like [Ptychodera flava]|uniref:N-acetyllactosaminide beta-1,6-N-acetylglucosaminyl-transferase-like n=1 Tax=Ptychodera flava TaxID=63121 RepID=UPI00396A9D74
MNRTLYGNIMSCRVRQIRGGYVAVLSLSVMVLLFMLMKQKNIDGVAAYGSHEDVEDSRRQSLKAFLSSDNTTCRDLTKGHISSQKNVQLAMAELQKHLLPDTAFVHLTQNCTQFANEGGYTNKQVTKEEEDFPLAFGIIMYKSAQQVEQLLRTIYRPHNIYCIHVDSKSSGELHKAMQAISSCFDNVFIASKSERVVWGSMSIVQAEMHCHEDALERNKKWKYFINLTGQEFPLKTNLEIVQILKTFNGQNDIATGGEPFFFRVKFKHRVLFDYMVMTPLFKTEPIPGNISLHRGELHSALTRDFIAYLHSDELAIKFYDWVRDTRIPDETFYQSLSYLREAPGGPGPRKILALVSRAKNWKPLGLPCHGKYVRNVCVFSWKDLLWLQSRPQLFANKFHINDDALVLQCLEEEINHRTLHPVKLNFELYEHFVENRYWPDTMNQWYFIDMSGDVIFVRKASYCI